MLEMKHYIAFLIAAFAAIMLTYYYPNCPMITEPINEEDNFYYDIETFQVTERPTVVNLDDLTFKHAFSIQRDAKGAGGKFYWNGKYYTTNLKEEQLLMDNPKEYRYVVKFSINNEQVNKLFDNELQAYTFAEMVDGEVVKYQNS